MTAQTQNTKYAFLKKENIQTSITKNEIDAYDYIFCTDTKELFVLDKNLKPHRIQTRFKVYDALSFAESALNTDTSMYAGEIITVKSNGEYTPYIINDISGKLSLSDMSGGLVQVNSLVELPVFGNEKRLYLVKKNGDTENEIYAWYDGRYTLVSSPKSYREITVIDGGDSKTDIKEYV